jgi:SAM-dependent methyltransferase
MVQTRGRSDDEVRRLKAVYSSYRSDERVGTRWAWGNAGNLASSAERVGALERILAAAGLLPLATRRILDVGCGAGRILADLLGWGASPASLHGIDLLPAQVERARRTFPGVDVREGNAEHLPFPDGAFDLVTLFTVFTSILDDEMQRNVAGEVRRVLRPGGSVVWYDFRYGNPYNPNVRGMPRRAIRALFPGFELHLRPVTVLPPLARRLGLATPVLYPALSRLPFLLTHWVGLLTKPAR